MCRPTGKMSSSAGGGAVEGNTNSLMSPLHPYDVLVPTLHGQPIETPTCDMIGEALAVISFKHPDDRSALEQKTVVKRNSFRNLHRPDISHLGWVRTASTDKQEVSHYKYIIFVSFIIIVVMSVATITCGDSHSYHSL